MQSLLSGRGVWVSRGGLGQGLSTAACRHAEAVLTCGGLPTSPASPSSGRPREADEPVVRATDPHPSGAEPPRGEQAGPCQAGPRKQPARLPSSVRHLHSTVRASLAACQAVSVPRHEGGPMAATPSLPPSPGSGREGPRAGEGSSVAGFLPHLVRLGLK